MLLEHIGLSARDPARLQAWYVETLGAKLLYCNNENPPAYLLRLGGGVLLEVYTAKSEPEGFTNQTAGWRHLAIRVSNLEAARDDLTGKGVVFTEAIKPAGGGGRVLFFNDPEGNLLHLVQRDASSVVAGYSLVDPVLAHRYFSAECFNKTWELLDKPERTPAEDQQMILRAQASLWHWTQRGDCTPQNLSIGYWQCSRVYAVVRQGENALRMAELCLEQSQNEGPFFLGYAHEAMARALMVTGDSARMLKHRRMAADLAEKVDDAEDRTNLFKDLASII